MNKLNKPQNTTPGQRFRKKIFVVLITSGIAFSIHYFWILYGAGEEGFTIIGTTEQTNSMEEVLALPELKGKVVYADMWRTTCGPCIKEFRHVKDLKKHFQDKKDIVFLYFSQDKHPGGEYRLRKMISKYQLNGYHFLLFNGDFVSANWPILQEGSSDARAYVPRYFIVDKEGNIVIQNAKRPSAKEELYAQIESVLNG